MKTSLLLSVLLCMACGKSVDGKEETVKAGEVFYWPAGHIPFVEKDLKIIDFSPEAEFNQLIAHLAKKIAEQPK